MNLARGGVFGKLDTSSLGFLLDGSPIFPVAHFGYGSSGGEYGHTTTIDNALLDKIDIIFQAANTGTVSGFSVSFLTTAKVDITISSVDMSSSGWATLVASSFYTENNVVFTRDGGSSAITSMPLEWSPASGVVLTNKNWYRLRFSYNNASFRLLGHYGGSSSDQFAVSWSKNGSGVYEVMPMCDMLQIRYSDDTLQGQFGNVWTENSVGIFNSAGPIAREFGILVQSDFDLEIDMVRTSFSISGTPAETSRPQLRHYTQNTATLDITGGSTGWVRDMSFPDIQLPYNNPVSAWKYILLPYPFKLKKNIWHAFSWGTSSSAVVDGSNCWIGLGENGADTGFPWTRALWSDPSKRVGGRVRIVPARSITNGTSWRVSSSDGTIYIGLHGRIYPQVFPGG